MLARAGSLPPSHLAAGVLLQSAETVLTALSWLFLLPARIRNAHPAPAR
jgi:hypothetical protein